MAITAHNAKFSVNKSKRQQERYGKDSENTVKIALGTALIRLVRKIAIPSTR